MLSVKSKTAETVMILRALNSKISLKLNIFSNLFGSLWTAALGILFVPIYLDYVGVEAYGIIGFFTTVQMFLFVFDFGFSPTFNREIAQLSASESPERTEKIWTLTKTLSGVNALVTLLIAGALVALSPLMASRWVQPETLSVETVMQCFVIMSIGFGCQFPINLYLSGLTGMQRQVTANFLSVGFGTLRSVGAFFVLAFVSPTIQAFLLWQVAVAFLQTAATAIAFYKILPPRTAASGGRFEPALIRRLWRFAAGNAGISLLSLILSQADKIVLSKIISLEEFGYYSITTMVAGLALYTFVGSVHKVSFPEFSAIVAANDEARLRNAYHKNAQMVSVLIIPATFILAFFSREILLLWTRRETIADKTWLLLTLYSIATGLQCLLWIPYGMQLAHGWTKLTFYKDLIGIFVFIPLLVWMVSHYGAIGGAISWIILSSANLFVYMWFMHRRILKNDLLHWYFWDVGLPLAAAAPVVFIGRLSLNSMQTTTTTADVFSLINLFAALSFISLLTFAAAACAAYSIRPIVFQFVSRFFSVRKIIHNKS